MADKLLKEEEKDKIVDDFKRIIKFDTIEGEESSYFASATVHSKTKEELEKKKRLKEIFTKDYDKPIDLKKIIMENYINLEKEEKKEKINPYKENKFVICINKKKICDLDAGSIIDALSKDKKIIESAGTLKNLAKNYKKYLLMKTYKSYVYHQTKKKGEALTLCEEIAHALETIKNKNKKIKEYDKLLKIESDENIDNIDLLYSKVEFKNIDEYYGLLGKIACFIKWNKAIKSLETPEEDKVIISGKKYLNLGFDKIKDDYSIYDLEIGPEKLWNMYNVNLNKKLKENIDKEKAHKETIESIENSIVHLENYDDLCHIIGYSLAEKEALIEKKDLKELFNQPRESVKDKMKKDLNSILNGIVLNHYYLYLTENITILERSPIDYIKKLKEHKKKIKEINSLSKEELKKRSEEIIKKLEEIKGESDKSSINKYLEERELIKEYYIINKKLEEL